MVALPPKLVIGLSNLTPYFCFATCAQRRCVQHLPTHTQVVPVWFYFWWNISLFNKVGTKKKVHVEVQFTNQLKYTSSKLEWANFDQNSWADTLLWNMTTLKRYVDPRTPASQLSSPFLLLQWSYYFLMAYSKNKSPHWLTRKVQSQVPWIFFSHPMHFSAGPCIICTAHGKSQNQQRWKRLPRSSGQAINLEPS